MSAGHGRVVAVLLGVALLAGCERGTAPRAPGPADNPTTRQAAPADADDPTAALPDDLTGELTALARRRTPVAEPLGRLLAEPATELHEPRALQRLYGVADPVLRFVTPDGPTPVGELLATELARAAEHGLPAARYHVDLLPALRQAWTDAARPPAPAPSLPALTPAERRQLRPLGRSLPPELPPAERRFALLQLLVSEGSPLPHLTPAFAALQQREAALALATARWELTLADGLLRFARDLSLGNVRPAERRARRQAARPAVAPAAAPAAPPGEDPPEEAVALEGEAPVGDGTPVVLQDPAAYVDELLVDALGSVTTPESLTQLLDRLVPPHPQYRPLLRALARYRELAAAGGWSVVPPVKRLRPGKPHPTIPLLEERLAREGFYDGPRSGVLDEALTIAIRKYQQAHQMLANGEVYDVFWKSLNIPVARRIQAIELTLQRWRESRIGDDPYYAFINIADFTLEVWRDGRRLTRNRVIVGQNKDTKCDEESETVVLAHATPIQSAYIENLTFAPFWNVTRTIKEKELDPERGKDPLYYQKNGYEVMRAGTPREWVREMPGPKNSLGFVKFIFPNPHATFVHDTPVKELFERPVRGFSHGCMRVDQPRQLAQLFLEQDGQWDQARFDGLYQTWQTMDFSKLLTDFDPDVYERLRQRAQDLEQVVFLRDPVPIHIEYYTVRVDDDGQTQFLADIYGYDEQQLNPRPPKSCVPESKQAKRQFARIPQQVEALERDAVALVPRVVAALALAPRLEGRKAWIDRALVKELPALSSFTQQHENLARTILDDHQRISQQIAARRGRWNKPLEVEAIRLGRLVKGLTGMTNKARQVCRQIEQRVAELDRTAAPP